MSRFNVKGTGTKTVNRAGGEAFAVTPELEFAALCLTTFLKNEFYRSQGGTLRQMTDLMNRIKDKKFVAQTGIFARTEFGMRSVSHVIAGELPKLAAGQGWVRHAVDKMVYRVDDITEILAYWFAVNGTLREGKNKLPNALKRGLAQSFDRFDAYQLAKYRAEGKKVSLVDVVNLVRPRPTDANAKALHDLIRGTLRSEDTWESKISQAGQGAESEEEKERRKADAWEELVMSGRISYFALLRNLRNISRQGSQEVLDAALKLLVDRKRIKGSLVLPFRFLTAYYTLMGDNVPNKVLGAISEAAEIALDNVPIFEGKTCVAIDRSGSMGGANLRMGGRQWGAPKGLGTEPFDIAAMFGAALAKTNDADVIMFSNDAQYISINPRSDIFGIIESLERHRDASGTNFQLLFDSLQKAYDRIVILSDMQGWMGYHAPTSNLEAYRRKYNCSPAVYSFDLKGYGTLMFPERSVYTLAGWSDKTFDIMEMFGEDPNALITAIKNVKI